jgi:hypothetical protein
MICTLRNWLRPFAQTRSLVENVLPDVTNIALNVLPVVDRDCVPVPDMIIDIFAVMGRAVPLGLMNALLVVEWQCSGDLIVARRVVELVR